MLFYIRDYKVGYRIAKIARSEKTCEELRQDGFETILICNDEVVIYPDCLAIKLSELEREKIEPLRDYDIVEISDRGIGYRLYSDSEGDTTVVTTARCNSNCIMCPAGEKERKRVGDNPLENIERFIEYLPPDLYNLVITGGEPTLVKENFFVIMELIKNKFSLTRVLLLTNGRSLSNREFFERFRRTVPSHFRVAVPIHGHVAELHDNITQTPGSFRQTLAGISNLLSAHMVIEIRVIVSKLNYDYLQEIAEFIADNMKGVFCVNFVGLEVRGNCAKNADIVYIDYYKAAQKMSPAIDILVKRGIDVGIYNYPLCLLDRRYWPIAEKSISGYKSKFYDECNECEVNESCCGIFKASMDFIKPEVFPIK